MALITQEKEQKITYKDQPLKLAMKTIKEINEYCTLFGVTKGREGLRDKSEAEKIKKAEERREFFIQEAIRIVLDLEKDDIEKKRQEKKK